MYNLNSKSQGFTRKKRMEDEVLFLCQVNKKLWLEINLAHAKKFLALKSNVGCVLTKVFFPHSLGFVGQGNGLMIIVLILLFYAAFTLNFLVQVSNLMMCLYAFFFFAHFLLYRILITCTSLIGTTKLISQKDFLKGYSSLFSQLSSQQDFLIASHNVQELGVVLGKRNSNFGKRARKRVALTFERASPKRNILTIRATRWLLRIVAAA